LNATWIHSFLFFFFSFLKKKICLIVKPKWEELIMINLEAPCIIKMKSSRILLLILKILLFFLSLYALFRLQVLAQYQYRMHCSNMKVFIAEIVWTRQMHFLVVKSSQIISSENSKVYHISQAIGKSDYRNNSTITYSIITYANYTWVQC